MDPGQCSEHSAAQCRNPSAVRHWRVFNRSNPKGASPFLAATVAAGSLPAVEGGIHATRPWREQRRCELIYYHLADARLFRPGWKPGSTSSRMADATVTSHRTSFGCMIPDAPDSVGIDFQLERYYQWPS